jgi:hypothetical protein
MPPTRRVAPQGHGGKGGLNACARARGAVEAQKLKKPARAEGYRTEGGRGDERFGGRAADRRQQEQGKQKPGLVDVSVTQLKP